VAGLHSRQTETTPEESAEEHDGIAGEDELQASADDAFDADIDDESGDAIVSFSAPDTEFAGDLQDALPEDDDFEEPDADASAEADDLAEFDDTIWERIPGVGAAEKARNANPAGAGDEADYCDDDEQLADGLSYTGTEYPVIDSKPVQAPEIEGFDMPATDLAADNFVETCTEDAETNATGTEAAGADEAAPNPEPARSETAGQDLDFDVPEDKWTAFFGAEPRPAVTPADDEQAAEGNDTVDHEPVYAAVGETVEGVRLLAEIDASDLNLQAAEASSSVAQAKPMLFAMADR